MLVVVAPAAWAAESEPKPNCDLRLRQLPPLPAPLQSDLHGDVLLEATTPPGGGRVTVKAVGAVSPSFSDWLQKWEIDAPAHEGQGPCPVRLHATTTTEPVLLRASQPLGLVAVLTDSSVVISVADASKTVGFPIPPSAMLAILNMEAIQKAAEPAAQSTPPAMENTVVGKRPDDGTIRREISEQELERVPGAFGDPIRSVASMPGVARAPVGLGPITIQGGRIGDTAAFIDDEPVPTLFHFDGWTSVLPPEMLASVDLLPSPTSVDLGRSVAGAVDARTRAGNATHLAGSLDVSTGQAGVFLEGPLPNGTSFQASFRRSYLELFEPLVSKYAPQAGLSVPVIPSYLDYGARVDLPAWHGHLSVLAYGSDDAATITASNGAAGSFFEVGGANAHLMFHRLTAQWTSLPPERIRKHASLVVGYDDDSVVLQDGLFFHSQDIVLAGRADLSGRFLPVLTWAAGLDVAAAQTYFNGYLPTPPAPDELPNFAFTDNVFTVKQTIFSVQPAVWGRITWKPGDHFELTPAFRADYDSLLNRAWADPRVSFIWTPRDRFSFRGAAGLAHQRPSQEKLLPVIGNPALHEDSAFDASVGVRFRLADPLTLEADVYSRTLYSAAVRTNTPGEWSTTPVPGNQLYTNDGQGYAYGVEALLRLAIWHGLFGWIAVSGGPTAERNSPSAPWEPVPFTQTYALSGVLSWELPRGFILGARARYTDGNPSIGVQSSLTVFDTDTENYIPVLQVPWWSLRTPPFFQLDARFEKRWEYPTWGIAAYLDVQNVTNYDNVEYYAYNYNYTQQQPIHGLGIFPMIGLRASLR
jgi:hypothetical protein